MTSNFCKTSWHPYGHTPEEVPDCQLCHESKIPKKLEFKPHLTTGVIARDRDMEMLVLWLNELRDYLQAKEEASNYKIVSFDPVGETVPCPDGIPGCLVMHYKQNKESNITKSCSLEASKGKCNCLCHFNRKPTKEEYAVSSYYGCEHCKSNPPEHEESIEDKYYELIMEVGKKYPGETRHQTALRYIRQAENNNNKPAKAGLGD